MKFILAMLQSEEENKTGTLSANCSGDTGDLALHLLRLDYHSGLQEQATSG